MILVQERLEGIVVQLFNLDFFPEYRSLLIINWFSKIVCMALKKIVLGAFVVGMIEWMQPFSTVNDWVHYHGTKPEKGFGDYRKYELITEITDSNTVQLYLGNVETDVYKKVQPDGTVGSLGESIDEFIDGTKKQLYDFMFGQEDWRTEIKEKAATLYLQGKKELKEFLK